MSRQSDSIKAKINNFCKENKINNEIVLRLFFMERFLERVSVSSYSSNFIFKGGFLVSSIVSITSRSTKDIDATCKKIDCSADNLTKVIKNIANIDLNDGVNFEFVNISEIIERSNYGGYRVKIRGNLDKTTSPLEIDISTDDAITPKEIKYNHQLLFESKSIELWTYNLETLLAEKLHAIIYFSTEITRMRDFFDVYILQNVCDDKIDYKLFSEAFKTTCIRRGGEIKLKSILETIKSIKKEKKLEKDWSNFQNQNPYADDLSWSIALKYLDRLVSFL